MLRWYSSSYPGSSSNGTSGNYECQSDSSWLKLSTGGGGSSCSTCDYSWSERWYLNGNSATPYGDTTCTNACRAVESPNYTHAASALKFENEIATNGTTLATCTYVNGPLSDTSVYYCSTDNSWKDFGEYSTCPATVEAFNAMAAANPDVTPCATNQCHAWILSRGNYIKTIDF